MATQQTQEFNPPDLNKAWEHFRTETLPRRVKDTTESVARQALGTEYRKAELGEPGELFPVVRSSTKDMSAFGLGIGLYFSALLGLFFVMLACGICASPTISYFKGDEYNGNQGTLTNAWLGGSAVCNYGDDIAGTTYYEFDGTPYEVHPCPTSKVQLGSDIALLLILTIFCVVTGRAQDKIVELIDESQQTAQDYAVVVDDPDADADSCDEWHTFFSKWGEVVYVTVARNNGKLLKALAKKRVIDKNIRFEDARGIHAQGGSDESEGSSLVEGSLPDWKLKLQPLGFFRNLNYWLEQRVKIRAQLDILRNGKYTADKVFVIYQTETAQRAALEDLCEGLVPAATNIGGTVKRENWFRGENLLAVSEPVEPSEVLWENLGLLSLKERMIQMGVTTALTVLLLVASFYTIEAASKSGSSAGAITVSAINVALPIILKVITMLETHVDAGDQQGSMLNKLVVARMLNTAVLIYVGIEFEDTLKEASIGQVNAILIADAFTAPTLRLLNIGGNLKQFVIARTAVTQEKMNSYFEGTAWNLAERYTDMSKTLFVSLFYSSLLPAGVFITALSMIVSYWVDKYCLLRQWKTPPALDDTLATKNRGHIIFAVYVHLIMTARFFAGWPFDYVCYESDGTPYYCDRSDRAFFFPRSNDFMSDEQATMVDVYGVTTLIMTIVLGVYYFYFVARYSFRALFIGFYDPVGEPQGIDYTSVDQIAAYVPQMHVVGLSKPLLCCDLSQINREHIDWTGDYDANNVCSTIDLPNMTEEEKVSLFSPIKCYNFGGATAEGVELQVADTPRD